MNEHFLFNIFIFLAAGSLIVPLASRFKLGSVLGYLAAGMLVGPFGFGLIANTEQIMNFAEFGVVMMLFLIGLELEPRMLWKLRKLIVGLGGLQVVLTAGLFTLAGMALGYQWQASLAVGMALALSSTALVLQMLQEKNILRTAEGESSFAVLLFQDIAVIPILIIMPLLAQRSELHLSGHEASFILQMPKWLHALLIGAVSGAVIIAGRYLSRYLFLTVAKTNLREVFTACSLALVVGITLLMDSIGVSAALGAFIAGVVLANSEYRHTIETDIQPFKGLLLGLFFISVGMGMNFTLFSQQPLLLIACVLVLVAIKASVLFWLGRAFGLTSQQTAGFAFGLAQGGEFAFVLFQYAGQSNVINQSTSSFFTLVVALSMMTTPFLMLACHRYMASRVLRKESTAHTYDEINQANAEQGVILAGYGRYGQIVGRLLRATGIHVTVLEKNPEQIELLRKFGYQVYFGDASRLDILKNAGIAKAKLLVVTVGITLASKSY